MHEIITWLMVAVIEVFGYCLTLFYRLVKLKRLIGLLWRVVKKWLSL